MTSAKCFCEILAVELRIAPGFGNRTYVHDLFHLMSREQVKEFLDRVGGVADCENWASHRHSIALSSCVSFEHRRSNWPARAW